MAVEERTAGVTLGQVAEGIQPVQSVADVLRAGYQRAQAEHEPKDIHLRGYGEPEAELHLLFDPIEDYEQLRERMRDKLRQKGLSAGKREIQLGIETLLAAARSSYALIGGERHELPPLGLELYDHIFPDDGSGEARPQNDQQAATLLYHNNTTVLMSDAMELDQWIKRGGREALEDALGE